MTSYLHEYADSHVHPRTLRLSVTIRCVTSPGGSNSRTAPRARGRAFGFLRGGEGAGSGVRVHGQRVAKKSAAATKERYSFRMQCNSEEGTPHHHIASQTISNILRKLGEDFEKIPGRFREDSDNLSRIFREYSRVLGSQTCVASASWQQ